MSIIFEDQQPDLIFEFNDHSQDLVLSFEDSLPPIELTFSEVGIVGPAGQNSLEHIFTYTMPVSQTTATFEHDLGRDPVAIQVIVDGQVADEYSVTFPLPKKSIQIGFDISVAAVIRLL